MKILTKILKVVLGIYFLMGGLYMSTNYGDLVFPSLLETTPDIIWLILAGLQIAFSVGLLLSVHKKFKKYAHTSLIGLTFISLIGVGIYTAYRGFPGLLRGVVPAAALIGIWFSDRCHKHI